MNALACTLALVGGLHQTFNEDFRHFTASPTGVIEARAVWRTTFNGGLRTLQGNHEVEYYADAGPGGPFSILNGTLAIAARPAAGLPVGLSYSSGLITTERSFSQTYGYFAICAQLPSGSGFWPAFWLLPADGGWPPEIDVMEMLGGDTRNYYASVHAGAGLNSVTKIAAPDLAAGFHMFAVSWRPDKISYSLDGVQVNEVNTPPDMHVPMYLLANLAVGGAGAWPGAAAGGTGVYRIAWIKAWQFEDLQAEPNNGR